jgi:WD repeat-containing protein 92
MPVCAAMLSCYLRFARCRWIPSSAKFVALGSHARGTGAFQVYGLDGPQLKLIAEYERKAAVKCGTFGASGLIERRLATGDFEGRLQLWDMENPKAPLYNAQAHASIVNDMDGCGGAAKGYGAPELATCGRDGCVRVWDVRQHEAPVAAFEPLDTENIRCAAAVVHAPRIAGPGTCSYGLRP